MERILTCITPQTNSLKLIDKSAEIAGHTNAELYILNVQKGGNIFFDEEYAGLLQELFSYGTKKGGSVQALAGDNIPQMICEFAMKHKITKIVLGEPKLGAPETGVIEGVERALNNLGIEIIILEREKQ